MKAFVFYNTVGNFEPDVLVKIIVTSKVQNAITIFSPDKQVSDLCLFNDAATFYIGSNHYYVATEDKFTIDSKYDIDKLTKLVDSLEDSENHYGWANSFGYCITHEDLTKLINECKKDFVSIADKISFLKEKNLFINGLNDEQINFYYEKFSEVK